MNATEILKALVGFPSVVGTSNDAIVEWIRSYLEGFGILAHVLPGPEGDRANLFASIGPSDKAGYILSGHMDVVPAQETTWTGDPFVLRIDGERLYGRGTTDMKGFLAAVLASVPALVALPLIRPIHLAFSYDEEAGCRGVPHLLSRLPKLCVPPLGAVIGEPSGMRPILAHKGKAAARIVLRGRSGHSSRPDLGVNAVHAMAPVLQATVSAAHALANGPFDPIFDPPYSSLQAGLIQGGQALNIIADHCTLDIETRAISGIDPATLLEPIRMVAEALRTSGIGVEWEELSAYPALSLARHTDLANLLAELTDQEPLAAVSYGTEAGLFQAAGVDAIICGPGDISRAHKPDEFILTRELSACQSMIEALGKRCCAQIPHRMDPCP
ncbi:acetylornithine deacetylase [Rhizobium sp. Root149]|uniref:acetylornithine deacetylase n=1 Tax=Rhizobium sp. Root149 TaxID=1736473 RepID=UPI00071328E1|nr:acetylornithine deacetylase [Rhizobium sp. Root149]KQZ62156.1 acetylornithine deacetylase [Rhizobium sp. Root149]